MIRAAIFCMERGALELDEGDEVRWFRDRKIEVFKIKSGLDYDSGVPLSSAMTVSCSMPSENNLHNVRLILIVLKAMFKKRPHPVSSSELVFISDDRDSLPIAHEKGFRTIAIDTQPAEDGRLCHTRNFSNIFRELNFFLIKDLRK